MSFLDRLRGGQQAQEASGAGKGGDDAEHADGYVAGERGVSAVQRPASLQSRVSNYLAAGLMGALALGLFGWYYAHSMGNRESARLAAQTSAQDKARGEIAVPPLGRIDPPVPSTFESLLGEAPEEPPEEPPEEIPEDWLQPAEDPMPG